MLFLFERMPRMSELIAITYPNQYRAAEVMAILEQLHTEHVIDIEGIVYVTSNDAGHIELHRTLHSLHTSTTQGIFWSLLLQALLTPASDTAPPKREQQVHEALLAILRILVLGVYRTGDIDGHFSQPTREFARQLGDLASIILSAPSVALIALEPGTDLIHPLAVVGLTPEQEQLFWRSLPGIRLEMHLGSSTLLAELESGKTLTLDLTRPPLESWTRIYNAQSMLIVPMCLEDQLVGVLLVGHPGTIHNYTPEMLTLAEAIAEFMALVLERERLLLEAQKLS
jgi:hypothetical protein